MRNKSEILTDVVGDFQAKKRLVEVLIDVRDTLSCIDDRLEQLVALKGGDKRDEKSQIS